jgi:hypothetical protein
MTHILKMYALGWQMPRAGIEAKAEGVKVKMNVVGHLYTTRKWRCLVLGWFRGPSTAGYDKGAPSTFI